MHGLVYSAPKGINYLDGDTPAGTTRSRLDSGFFGRFSGLTEPRLPHRDDVVALPGKSVPATSGSA